jgi:hypothetical protein
MITNVAIVPVEVVVAIAVVALSVAVVVLVGCAVLDWVGWW